MLNRNNMIVLLLILLWTGTWAVKTDRIDLPWPSTSPAAVSVVAFVMDNDAPDVRFEDEVDMAIAELRVDFPSVVKIDETPESVTAIQQGPVLVAAAKGVGVPAIVLLGENDNVILAVAAKPRAAEMVGQVRGK